MKQIEDKRISFYLEHRQHIEEWAKVGTEDLPQFAHEFYAGLECGLRDQAQNCETFDGAIDFVNHSNWPYIRLRRCWWPSGEEDPFVCLQWARNVRGQADFSRNQLLICGISAKRGNPHRDVLPNLQMDNYPEKPDEWWPKYRRVNPPGGKFWEGNNLKEHGHDVIKTVLKAWCDLAPLVNEAVKSHNQ